MVVITPTVGNDLTHKKQVEKKKKEEAANVLRHLVEKTTIVLGKGSGKSHSNKRVVLDSWINVNGEQVNLSGHLNERISELVLLVCHYSRKPLSFAGVPIVLTPNIKPGDERCDRTSSPTEVLFKETDTCGEYRAYFTNLAQGSYTLRIGDPNVTVFGNPRQRV